MTNFVSGEISYYRQKESVITGPWVLISRDKKTITLKNYENGESDQVEKVFTLKENTTQNGASKTRNLQ